MDNHHIALIVVIVLVVLLSLKILLTIAKIRRIRSSGSNAHKKSFFYKFVSKVFMKDLPD